MAIILKFEEEGILFDGNRRITRKLCGENTKRFRVLNCRRRMVAIKKLMDAENNPEGYGYRTAQY
jgi:hypothetical protein